MPEQDSIYWLFTDPKRDLERELIGGLPVLCRYSLPDGNIIVLGKSRAALPAAMRDCTVGESAMSGSD